MVTNNKKTRDRNNREEYMQYYNKNIEFHVELKRHKAAGCVPDEMMAVMLGQNRRNADTGTQRCQTKQMINNVCGGQETIQILAFPVQFCREHADHGQCRQRARLKRMRRIENPHNHTTIFHINTVLMI